MPRFATPLTNRFFNPATTIEKAVPSEFITKATGLLLGTEDSSPCVPDMNQTAANILLSRQQTKKEKYLGLCHLQRAHFTPFALSTSGQFAPEAYALLTRLAQLLSEKWTRTMAVVHRYVREQVSLALVRACTHCVFGQRAHRFSGPPFEDGTGLPACPGPSAF